MARLNDLAGKWFNAHKAQVVLEQFLKTLPDDVRVFERERQPKTSMGANRLADHHLRARKEDQVNHDTQVIGEREGDKLGKCAMWQACTSGEGLPSEDGKTTGTREGVFNKQV